MNVHIRCQANVAPNCGVNAVELAPDVVVTAPLLGWWFRVLGHMGECGEQSREPQAHLLFSPASRRLKTKLSCHYQGYNYH